ncbi:hypothetical protein FEM33_01680 [Dyadobacter flavalbus]|uniref:Uncharacterized protein n=1 Tax=Dyadobacter flavalbus TaxID=2579942 RepID=A0A5M8R1D0_9BACT|nr:hypothetical protein [Dyadobacter flavalbus]KAA6441471.1 hypothetical protein FEM33_01680 [Dyadobacter flavalbus]
MEEQDFDQVEAEKRELDILNSKGVAFEVGKRWTGWLSKNKTRTFTIKPHYLGVMDRLSAEFIHLDLDEELIKADTLLEARKLTGRHARRCAKIVAISVLNNNPFYFLLVGFLTGYFMWRIDSRMLFQLTVIINGMNNYKDFIDSIRYLSIARTTKPQLMENQINED